MRVIKREEWSGEGQVPIRKKSVNSGKFKIELTVPRERLEQELSILKKEMMQDVEILQRTVAEQQAALQTREAELTKKQQQVQSDQAQIEQSKTALTQKEQTVLEEARQKGYDAGFKEGRDKGYKQGLEQGRTEGKAEFEGVKAEAQKSIQEMFAKIEDLDQYKNEILEKTEPFLLDLLSEIVKKVVSAHMEINSGLIIDVVRDALKLVTSGVGLVIRVHPDGVDVLEKEKPKIMSTHMTFRNLQIVGDEFVHPGGCLIEADLGMVDARVETKLETIMEAIRKVQLKDDSSVGTETSSGEAPPETPSSESEEEIDEKPASLPDDLDEDEDELFSVDDEGMTLEGPDLDIDDLSFLDDLDDLEEDEADTQGT